VHPQAGVAVQSAVGTSKATRLDPINKTIVILLKPILKNKIQLELELLETNT
jgi:hypothetical protein